MVMRFIRKVFVCSWVGIVSMSSKKPPRYRMLLEQIETVDESMLASLVIKTLNMRWISP
jgi:hypothetical protein